MKIKKIILAYVFIIAITFTACGNERNENEKVKNYFLDYVTEYEVKERLDDGSLKISILAPDVIEIANKMLDSEKNDNELSLKKIKKLIKKHPDIKKEYIIESRDENIENIENAFLKEISDELILEALNSVEYTDDMEVND